jgi:hypothetical protein
MSNQLGTTIAGLLIGISIIFGQLFPRYQVASIVDASGNVVAWRVNTVTGGLELCAFYPRHHAPGRVGVPFDSG